jgi:hypothetical protein
VSKLYLRDTTANTAGYVATELSTVLPVGTSNQSGVAAEDLAATAGTSAVTQALPALGQTAHQDGYFRKFISPVLAVSSVDAETWTLAVAVAESSSFANAFIVCSVYVLTSGDTVRGFVYDSDTPLGSEWATGLTGEVVTFSGAAVSGVVSTDRLVLEFWVHSEQGMPSAYNRQLNYNGTTEPTDGAANSNSASYLETPQDLFTAGTTPVGDTVDLLWDIRAPLGDTTQLLWDDRAALGDSNVLSWDIFTPVSDSVEFQWDIWTPVGASIQALWDLRFALGDEASLLWDDQAAVGDAIQALWDIYTSAADQLQLAWDQMTVLGDELGMLWDAFAAVGDEIQALWDLRAAVFDDNDLRWDLQANISDTLSLLWDILGDFVFLVPVSTVANDGWDTGPTPGGNLWENIDEAEADDNDYITLTV